MVNPEWEGGLGLLPAGTRECQEAGARIQGTGLSVPDLWNWEKKQGGAWSPGRMPEGGKELSGSLGGAAVDLWAEARGRGRLPFGIDQEREAFP